MRNRKMLIGCAALLVCGTVCADLADYVDPFVGTSATGHTFPGACVPFGMVQASPDGGTESWHYCSGYRFEDKEIKGFSQTHLNGTGGCELGDVRILPFVGERPDFVEKIDKKTETAKPGYYAVTLTDSSVRAEVTASERAAIYRFTFEKGAEAHLLV
ncbi:MAG: glycoside hydrolase family 92 protein, partial [bacterium]|nr:glycoside hydrolase family 92 protein [Candidatus Colisoma equi]